MEISGIIGHFVIVMIGLILLTPRANHQQLGTSLINEMNSIDESILNQISKRGSSTANNFSQSNMRSPNASDEIIETLNHCSALST